MKMFSILCLIIFLSSCNRTKKVSIIGHWATNDKDFDYTEFYIDSCKINIYTTATTYLGDYRYIIRDDSLIYENGIAVKIEFKNDSSLIFIEEDNDTVLLSRIKKNNIVFDRNLLIGNQKDTIKMIEDFHHQFMKRRSVYLNNIESNRY